MIILSAVEYRKQKLSETLCTQHIEIFVCIILYPQAPLDQCRGLCVLCHVAMINCLFTKAINLKYIFISGMLAREAFNRKKSIFLYYEYENKKAIS